MKVLTNLINRGHVVLMDNGNVFPSNPMIGQFALVSGVLYIYTEIDSISAWHPLTKQIQNFKYVQGTPSTNWVITHNLNTNDLIVGVYDDTDTINFPSNIVFTDLNSIRLEFTEALSGRALIFSMSDTSTTGANFKYYTETVYPIGTKNSNFIVNATNGSVQTVSLSGPCQCSFTGFPLNLKSAGVVLNITNGKDNITFPGVKWPGGTVPTLSTGIDRLFFTSDDGGTTIFGLVSGIDLK